MSNKKVTPGVREISIMQSESPTQTVAIDLHTMPVAAGGCPDCYESVISHIKNEREKLTFKI